MNAFIAASNDQIVQVQNVCLDSRSRCEIAVGLRRLQGNPQRLNRERRKE